MSDTDEEIMEAVKAKASRWIGRFNKVWEDAGYVVAGNEAEVHQLGIMVALNLCKLRIPCHMSLNHVYKSYLKELLFDHLLDQLKACQPICQEKWPSEYHEFLSNLIK